MVVTSTRAVKDWIEEWKLLKKKEQFLTTEAKQGSDTLTGARILWEDHESDLKRIGILKESVFRDVSNISRLVENLQFLVENVEPGRNYVQELMKKIDSIDLALSSFKERQGSAWQELTSQEAELDQAVADVADKLDDMLTISEPVPQAKQGQILGLKAGHARRQSLPGSTTAPEVAALDEFMACYGETGGWHIADHAEFLETLKVCNNDYVLTVRVCAEKSVGFTQQELLQHAQWHMELVDLQVRKKLALAEWRAKREQQRAAALQAEEMLGSDVTKVQRDSSSKVEKQHVVEEDRALKKELVARWKAEKEEEARLIRQRDAELAAMAAERKALELQQRQAANKAMLEERRAREAEAEHDARQVAAARAALSKFSRSGGGPVSPRTRLRVKERNSSTLRRRQLLAEEKEAAKTNRSAVQAKILEQVSIEAPRDPERLLKGTQAHIARKEATLAKELMPKDSSFILHSSRRVTPLWRGNLPTAS